MLKTNNVQKHRTQENFNRIYWFACTRFFFSLSFSTHFAFFVLLIWSLCSHSFLPLCDSIQLFQWHWIYCWICKSNILCGYWVCISLNKFPDNSELCVCVCVSCMQQIQIFQPHENKTTHHLLSMRWWPCHSTLSWSLWSYQDSNRWIWTTSESFQLFSSNTVFLSQQCFLHFHHTHTQMQLCRTVYAIRSYRPVIKVFGRITSSFYGKV